MSVDPVSLSAMSLAIGALTAGSGLMGQMQTAKSQASAARQQQDAEMQAYRDNIVASNTKTLQDAKASSEKANEAALESRKAQATAITAAGEAGVTGLSVGALLNDLSGQGLDNTQNIESNYLRRRDSTALENEQMRNGTVSGLNSIARPTSPDFIGAGLGIATKYVDGRITAKKSTLFD